MDFEDGELTMIVKTTRLSKKAIRRIQDLAILQQYLRKQQTKVTFQDALDFAITFTDENYTQVMGNMPNKDIAQSSIAEIQPQNIPHEILQTATPQQIPEPQTLQTASKKIAGMTIEEIQEKAKESVKEPYNDYIAPSKQEKKKDNVIQLTPSKKKLFKSIGVNGL